MAPSKPVVQSTLSKVDSFTVKEYRIYSELVNTPMSVPEPQALQKVGKRHGLTVAKVKKDLNKVLAILSRDKWFG